MRSSGLTRLLLVAMTATLLLGGLWLAPPEPVSAATITVNSTADVNSNDGQCTLREAIRSMNDAADALGCVNTGAAYGVDDLIHVPAGVYTLTRAETDPGLRDLDVRANVVISGAGAATTIVQANAVTPTDPSATFSRVFEVSDGSNYTDPLVVIRDMTVRHGKLTGYCDCSEGPEDRDGAGVRNNESLALLNVIVASNWITSTDEDAQGGGIWNNGVMTVTDSIVEHNEAGRGGPVSLMSTTSR
ncbi:MAG: CSLREA domain-containing protein [Caldilineaceae bacterium]|nr:CSLREA domain-containing protein [Caldilineaceae bacterium]